MIRINLLAVDRERVKRRPAFQIGQQVTVACSLILVAAGLGIGWWYWSLNTASAKLDEDITAAQREMARLSSLMQQVQLFDQKKGQLQQRVTLIEQLRKGQTGPVHMIDEISKAVPDMLWLTELKQAGADLTIMGRSTTSDALATFVSNLEASGYFRRPVEILEKQVASAADTPVELISFTLKAQFSPPGA
jgi:type IV pilus assembly protein PilN